MVMAAWIRPSATQQRPVVLCAQHDPHVVLARRQLAEFDDRRVGRGDLAVAEDDVGVADRHRRRVGQAERREAKVGRVDAEPPASGPAATPRSASRGSGSPGGRRRKSARGGPAAALTSGAATLSPASSAATAPREPCRASALRRSGRSWPHRHRPPASRRGAGQVRPASRTERHRAVEIGVEQRRLAERHREEGEGADQEQRDRAGQPARARSSVPAMISTPAITSATTASGRPSTGTSAVLEDRHDQRRLRQLAGHAEIDEPAADQRQRRGPSGRRQTVCRGRSQCSTAERLVERRRAAAADREHQPGRREMRRIGHEGWAEGREPEHRQRDDRQPARRGSGARRRARRRGPPAPTPAIPIPAPATAACRERGASARSTARCRGAAGRRPPPAPASPRARAAPQSARAPGPPRPPAPSAAPRPAESAPRRAVRAKPASSAANAPQRSPGHAGEERRHRRQRQALDLRRREQPGLVRRGRTGGEPDRQHRQRQSRRTGTPRGRPAGPGLDRFRLSSPSCQLSPPGPAAVRRPTTERLLRRRSGRCVRSA